MLKKILLASIFVITAITNVAHAEDDMKTVASKAYVDTMIETKQLKIPAAGQPNVGAGETVMTYTATGNGQIGERGLYSDISSYDATTDADKLITASALNATFTNLPTTPTTKLECANQADGCTLWTIVDQTAYGDMLPSGYTQLEYIESTGTQYINFTNAGSITVPITQIESRARVSLSMVTTTRQFVMGLGAANVAHYVECDQQGKWGLGTDQTGTPVSVIADRIYNLKSIITPESHTLYVDGVLSVSVDSYQSGSVLTPRTLFKLGTSGTFKGEYVRIHAYTLYNNNDLILNLIPAKRNSDNVLGMYDTVSGRFFTNAATSGPDFTPGPVAN